MANIKNFGIKGVADDVQLGKGGGHFIYDKANGKFSLKDNANALENVEFANVLSGTWNGTEVGVNFGGTGLTSIAADKMLYTSSANVLATTDITAYGRSVISSADATALRTTLGLGSIATQDSDSVALTGGSIDGVTIGGSTAAAGSFTTLSFDSLSDGSLSIAGFIDDDTMATASNTTLATSGSVKAYVDAQITAQDLDFVADSGGALSVDLDSQTFGILGGTGLSTAGAGSNVTVSLDDTAVSAGSYGSASAVATFTVDAQGRLTAAADATISITASQVSDFNAAVDAHLVGGTGIDYTTGTIDLADTAVTAGDYGSATQIPTFTVDAQGRITAASNVAISTSWTLSDGTTSQSIDGGDTLTVQGTANEIEVAVSATDTLTIGLPDDVTIGGNLSVTGTLNSDDITAATVNVNGDAVISGNLTVNGTQTIVNSTVVSVDDAVFRVNSDGASQSAGLEANIAGEIESVLYNPVSSRWELSGDVHTADSMIADGGFTGDLTGDVTGNVTGQVSDISNHDTDALSEGSTNLYFTDARARSAISVTDAGGDGSLSYNSATGVITYTGPSAAEVRAHFSGGTGVTITDGEVAIGQDVGTSANVTFNSVTADLTGNVTGDVTGNVTGQVSDISNHDTDALAEGASNLYFTDARANSAMDAYLTGGTGLSYASGEFSLDNTAVTAGSYGSNVAIPTFTVDAQGRLTDAGEVAIATGFDIVGDDGTVDAFAGGDTLSILGGDNVTTATSNDTITVALDADITVDSVTATTLTGDLTGDVTGNLTGDVTGNVTGDLTGNVTGQVSDISNHDTDALSEGSSNLYFTNSRARSAISVTDAGGDGSLSYDSGTGVITYTGPSAAEVRAHFSAGTGVTITDGVIAIGQDVSTTADVTFNNVTVDGNLITDDITAASVTASGDLTVSGNLTVNGATTTLSSVNTTVEDTLFELNSGASASSGDIGILMERGSTGDNTFMGWDESADRFAFSTTANVASDTGDLSLTDADIQFASAHASGDINVSGNVASASGDLTLTGATGSDSVDLNAMTIAGGAVRITSVLDEDDMSSNSATALATQQSIVAYVDSKLDEIDDLLLRASQTADGAVDSFTVGTMPSADGRSYFGMRAIVKVGTAFTGGSIDALTLSDGTNTLVAATETDLTVAGTYIVDLGAESIASGATVTASFVQADGSTASTPSAGAVTVTVEYKFSS